MWPGRATYTSSHFISTIFKPYICERCTRQRHNEFISSSIRAGASYHLPNCDFSAMRSRMAPLAGTYHMLLPVRLVECPKCTTSCMAMCGCVEVCYAVPVHTSPICWQLSSKKLFPVYVLLF